MKRAGTFGFLAILTLVFLFTQLYLLYVYHSGKIVEHSLPVDDPPNSEYIKSGLHKTISYDNIQDVASACEKYGSPLFLIDTPVLYTVLNGSSHPGACRFLCNSQPVTTLAVLRELWKNSDKVTSYLRQKHFEITYVTEPDPTHLDLSASPQTLEYVPTHYIFQRGQHTVHLLVLYDRSNSLWWYGSLLKNENAQIHGDGSRLKKTLLDQDYTSYAGLLDRVDMVKVTIDGLQIRAPRYPVQLLKQLPYSRFIECNYTRASLYFLKYGHENGTEAVTFRKVAVELISAAAEALNSIGIPFWLSSGTCLGWFRQCDTIAYSLDVDIGICIKDFKDSLIPAMKDKGLHLKHILGKVSDSYQLSFQAGGLKIDIFFFYEEDNYMWNGATHTTTGEKYKYIFSKFSLCWTLFLNLKVRVPCDTLTYIEANYGKHWHEQAKQWDWRSSPPNVQPNGQWPKNEWPEVIKEFDDPVYV